ncbi:MAG: DUF3786 domain-containing protein [Pseudomonadota bacterium]
MARKDDYENAFKLAAKELGAKDPVLVAELAGCAHDPEARGVRLEFIGRPHLVSFPEIDVRPADGGDEVPLTEKVLILHYLNQANGAPVKNEAVTYRETPSGEFYYQAFYKRAEAPLVSAFGPDPELLPRTAPKIGGRPEEGMGDAAARFQALPRVPVTLVVWGGDEEFEPSGNILFDRSIQNYLSAEDIAWLSGMIVYRLMRLAKT